MCIYKRQNVNKGLIKHKHKQNELTDIDQSDDLELYYTGISKRGTKR